MSECNNNTNQFNIFDFGLGALIDKNASFTTNLFKILTYYLGKDFILPLIKDLYAYLASKDIRSYYFDAILKFFSKLYSIIKSLNFLKENKNILIIYPMFLVNENIL